VEKIVLHCKLAIVKTYVEAGKVRSTVSALTDAKILGFNFEAMIDVVLALTRSDFYKSMTSHSNYRIWQDVYRPVTPTGRIYVKLTMIDDVLIVSFKEM
jgi:motility quorum-sensing regulator/GCU-specific mRNA interferase toxin